MPLHLLGKKSWNPYSAANMARVRRDEAAARAQEEAEEQRMQEVDAARRLAILRGEEPPPLEQPDEHEPLPPSQPSSSERHAFSATGERRKRKRHGEDDTDFEMRLARERAEVGERAGRELTSATTPFSRAPASLVDSRGHISLFSPSTTTASPSHGEKNKEAERDAARKKREFEDQHQMRFVNAAGKNGRGLTDGGPWYTSGSGGDGDASGALALAPTRDVFGGEDPKRKDREAQRLGASDPLAMMKRGAAKVRELEKGRRREAEERERELEELRREDRRRERRRREDRERSYSPKRRAERGDRSYRRRGRDDEGREKYQSKERRRDQSKDRERYRHREEEGEKRRTRHGEREEKGRHKDDDSPHPRSSSHSTRHIHSHRSHHC